MDTPRHSRTPLGFAVLVAALSIAGMILGGAAGCTRLVTEIQTDTVTRIHTDTVTKTVVKTDTLVTVRHDTTFVTHTDTVPGPTVHDTTIVTRVDTVVTVRVDTLTLPAVVVHDTTWIYLATNPTNPLAGGDPTSGLMVLEFWPQNYLTFWHGHFVGVIEYWYTDPATRLDWYVAYAAPHDGSILMPAACTVATLDAAAKCLEPVVLTLTPGGDRAERLEWRVRR